MDPRTSVIGQFIISIGTILHNATLLLGSLAILVFFWGIVKYIAKRGSEKGVEEAKHTIQWGLIALFVMFTVWGLVQLLSATFGVPINGNIFYKPANTTIVQPGQGLI